VVLTEGAETTSLSSVMANRLFGSVCWDSCEVIFENALEPVPSKDRVTIQPLPCWVS
jgi:hypothetical protein